MSKQSRKNYDPDLLSRLWSNLVLSARLLFDRRVGGTAKLIPLLAALYILSPLDLMPDALLPFGVVDDLGALLLGLQLFIRNAPPEVVEEYRGRVADVAGATRRVHSDKQNVIEGHYQVKDE